MLQMLHLTDRVSEPSNFNLATCGGVDEMGIMDAQNMEQGLKLEKLQPLTYQLSGTEIVGGSYSATLLKTVAGRYYTAVELVAGAYPCS